MKPQCFAPLWLMLGVALSMAGCGWWRTTKDVQRDYAHRLRPAELGSHAAAPAPRETRVMRLRVYADANHQAQVRRWEERFHAQVERANDVLRPRFGISLVIESARPWPRSRTDGRNLEDDHQELIAHDPGGGVDWVVGLVSSLPVFSATLDQLGVAPYFGRHFILRGMENVEEANNLNSALSALSEGEREALIRERRLHKETAVLLHELGHTLGAFHERTWDWLMSPVYQPSHVDFSDGAAALIDVGLQHRDASSKEERAAWAKAWRAAIERHDSAAWSGATKQEALTNATAVLEDEGPARRSRFSARDAATYNEALELHRRGDDAAARKVLRPLMESHADEAQVQAFACLLTLRGEPGTTEALRSCRAASILAPEEPLNALRLGHALLDAKDLPGAMESLLAVHRSATIDAADEEKKAYLAALFQQAASPSLAEAAAARAPNRAGVDEVLKWARRVRVWNGLRPESPVAAEREYEIIQAMEQARRALGQNQTARAQSRRTYLKREFEGVVAEKALACEIAGAGGRLAEIKRECGKAIASWEELAIPHWLLGRASKVTKQWGAAEKHLRRTIELAPELHQAWLDLSAQYAARGRADSVEALNAQYRVQFGRELAAAP